ncbi:hypothetical protein ACJ65_12000 [Kocuria rhizophila]|nr:hypothetical protein ACJ65_12000 [Kocuria rhizophila]
MGWRWTQESQCSRAASPRRNQRRNMSRPCSGKDARWSLLSEWPGFRQVFRQASWWSPVSWPMNRHRIPRPVIRWRRVRRQTCKHWSGKLCPLDT